MENNTYNNFNGNNTDESSSGHNTNGYGANNAGENISNENSPSVSYSAGTDADTGSTEANSATVANTAAAETGRQESSSAYGYSYINQEQKNPYAVWRADENTANARADGSTGNTYGGTQSDGNFYNSAQYGGSNAYNNAQSSGGTYGSNAYGGTQDSSAYGSQSGSSTNNAYGNTQSGNQYSHIYGNANAQGSWNNYDDVKKQKKEERARKRAEKAGNANSNFGIKVAKCASIALIFGLVAGTTFEGASYVTGNLLGTNKQEIVSTEGQDQQKEILKTPENTQTTAVTTASAAGVDVSAIVEECMPSIVAITNLSQVQVQNFFGQVQNYEVPSAGSGVIIAEDDDYLYIATNNHVVESATTLTIQFNDETTASAEVKGTDRSSDLAVVKVNKSDIEKETLQNIKVATLGDSDNVKVGSQAIAIGNALGYGQSVTGGWVSALNREVTIQDEKTGESFTNELLQTDAAINPGNSGGALLNSDGEVIGINSSKYSDTDVEGMGFAIPANTAKPIIEDLIKREVVSDDKAAYLGLVGVDVTSTISSTYNIPEGVCITELIRGAAAEQYGLQKGDIITKFDGKAVKSSKSLENTLTYYEAGSEVDIVIQRASEGGYQEQTVKVVLGKKNS